MSKRDSKADSKRRDERAESARAQDDMKAWVSLLRGQQKALRAVELALKRNGFPPLIWYDVLLELGRSDAGLRHKDLHQHLLLEKYNLSRLLDRMEQQGLILREESKEDGRGAQLKITAKGKTMRRKMWPVYNSAVTENFSSHYDRAELKQLNEFLRRL